MELLSNTKLPKNIRQQIIGCDLTGDLPQKVKCLTDVHRHEVTGNAVVHSQQYAVKRFVRTKKIFIVAQIGDEYITLLHIADMKTGEDGVFQFLDVQLLRR